MDATDEKSIAVSAKIIRDGGLVAFPTETVYGLGADVENPLAVAGIFEAKGRPRIDPLIVHVSDREMAERYGCFPRSSLLLMEKFWPGPLTLVVPRKEIVPDIVTAGLDTVAVRVPAHSAALALIQAAGRGIAAPSANPFGYVSPTDAAHVVDQLGDKVDGILDGGACSIGVESTIISLSGETSCILRPGGTPVEAIAGILGPLEIRNGAQEIPQAPGQLQRHYATRTPLSIIEEGGENLYAGEKLGLLSLFPPDFPEQFEAVEILSASGNMREAAANLFRSLRRLDALGLERIIARPVPETGLGLAIMDRLRRCSFPKTAGEEHKHDKEPHDF